MKLIVLFSKSLEIVKICVIYLMNQVDIWVEIRSEAEVLICPRMLNKKQALHGVQHLSLSVNKKRLLTSLNNAKTNERNRMKYNKVLWVYNPEKGTSEACFSACSVQARFQSPFCLRVIRIFKTVIRIFTAPLRFPAYLWQTNREGCACSWKCPQFCKKNNSESWKWKG